jgi:signal transduction histidine kinase
VGIDEKDLPRIFDSLYHSDASRMDLRAGLGLTVAHQIVTV